ncbi:infB [Acrasis kona]|uniref:InfB n=1 Tax=Acrasis kona TaxID=1008807 RepID=A0AAW2YIF3_9EUKA
MRLVCLVLLLCCSMYVYCGDSSCNSNVAGRYSNRSLSVRKPRLVVRKRVITRRITTPRKTVGPKVIAVTPSRNPYFFSGYAPYSKVTLVKKFDGSNGPITREQFYDSQITFAKGQKGCEFCVFDCWSTYIMNQNRNTPSEDVYTTLFKDCKFPYYAYSCQKPSVVSGGNEMSIEANTNCKKTTDLSDNQILGVLDICASYGQCTFAKKLTKNQVLDGFRYKNGMVLSNTIYTTRVDKSSGEMRFEMKM